MVKWSLLLVGAWYGFLAGLLIGAIGVAGFTLWAINYMGY